MPTITPSLWFDTEAEEAAKYYCSVFPNSKINTVTHYTEASGDRAGSVLTVDFELDGRPFNAINGGPDFHFTEAVSLIILCKDQTEIDAYWSKLTEGGEEGPCGWVKDKYGLSWQIAPKAWIEMLTDPDREAVNRGMEAMMGMKKLDLAALQAAFAGKA
jgi:predicted 3-demethylubiquinone-9 3-methyltransferase (glyoxalase superfamily)